MSRCPHKHFPLLEGALLVVARWLAAVVQVEAGESLMVAVLPAEVVQVAAGKLLAVAVRVEEELEKLLVATRIERGDNCRTCLDSSRNILHPLYRRTLYHSSNHS